MVATTPSTIALTPPCRTLEVTASAALSPGHVAELHSSTGNKVRKNTRAALPGTAKLVALEKEYLGKGITDAYASADTVIIGVFKPGSEVTLRVAAAATAIVFGDKLECAGDGTVRKQVGYLTDNSGGTANTTLQDISASPAEAEIANNFADVAAAINALGVFAIALEAVDNSGGGSEAFIRALIV